MTTSTKENSVCTVVFFCHFLCNLKVTRQYSGMIKALHEWIEQVNKTMSGFIFDANFKTRCSGHDGVEKLPNVVIDENVK